MRDADYVQRVRRYAPSRLVPLVAYLGSRLRPAETRMTVEGTTVTPWALADVARVSMSHGNEHRHTQVGLPELLRCIEAYNDLEDPELSAQRPGAPADLFLRLAGEQLVYNLPPKATISRSVALLTQTIPSGTQQVMHPGWAEELLGCSVADFVGTGFLLHTACGPNSGRFDLTWLDDENSLSV